MTKLVKMMSKIIQGELCIYVDDLRLKTIMYLKKSFYRNFLTQIKLKHQPPTNTFPIAIGSVQLVLFAIIDSILN